MENIEQYDECSKFDINKILKLKEDDKKYNKILLYPRGFGKSTRYLNEIICGKEENT